MATTVFCAIVLCLYSLTPPSESATPAVRSQEVPQTFILSGGPRSNLFSQCLENAMSVEGTLHSISVSEDEKFVRFVPAEKMEFDWAMVELGDAEGIIGCAQKAFDDNAFMFKLDGSCHVALNFAYDPKSEQGCDGAATEVVYITSRPFFSSGGQVFNSKELEECQYDSSEGITYGEGGRLMSEVELPPPVTCCDGFICGEPAKTDFCLKRHMVDGRLNHCEAQFRCKAMELSMASKSFYDEIYDDENGYDLPSLCTKMWINIRKLDGVWLWVPEMVEFPVSEFDETPADDHCCAFMDIVTSGSKLLRTTRCNETYAGVYCYDPSSTLPRCNA